MSTEKDVKRGCRGTNAEDPVCESDDDSRPVPAGADLRAAVLGSLGFALRRGRVGAAQRRHHLREGRDDLRAGGRRVPQDLVADRDQRRRPEVLPRPLGTPERETRSAR